MPCHHAACAPTIARARSAIAAAALATSMGLALAQTTPPLRKYVGSPDYPALLREPAVKANLQAVLGKQLPRLMQNISVTSDIDRIGGALAIVGNAPHKGGEEEGVICVSEYDGKVEAAIFSKSHITVFAKDRNYDNLMLCIKDWITQVNSQHRDRFKQPNNVQFGKLS